MRALPGGLSSPVTLDAYLISFTDVSRLREGVYAEGCVPLHCALVTPGLRGRATVSALSLVVAHTLWCTPAAPSIIYTRYVSLANWAVEAAGGNKIQSGSSPAADEAVIVPIAALAFLLSSLATTLSALGRAGRIPDTEEAYATALAICTTADPPPVSKRSQVVTGISAKSLAIWALTPAGTHSLSSRWSHTVEAFFTFEAKGALPKLVAIASEVEALALARSLLEARHVYGENNGVWEKMLILPGLRSGLAAMIDTAGSQISDAEYRAVNSLRTRTVAEATSMNATLEFAATAGLTASSLPPLRIAFAKVAGVSGQLNREGFTIALREALPDFSEAAALRLFEAFDQDGSGAVSFSEFVIGIGSVARGSVDEKVAALWTCFSDDALGIIRPADLLRFVNSGATTFATEAFNAREAVANLFAAAGPPKSAFATLTMAVGSPGGWGIEDKINIVLAPPPSRDAFAVSAVSNPFFLSWLRATLARPAIGTLRRALLDATPHLLAASDIKPPPMFERSSTLAGSCPEDASAFDKTPMSYSNVESLCLSLTAALRGGGGGGGKNSPNLTDKEALHLDGSVYLAFLRSTLVAAFSLREPSPADPVIPALFNSLQILWKAFVQVSAELCDKHHAETLPLEIPTRDVLFALAIALARTDTDAATALHRFLDVNGDGKVYAPAVLAWMLSAQERTDATFAAAARVLAATDRNGDGNVTESELRAAVIHDPSLYDAFSLLLGGARAGPAPKKKNVVAPPRALPKSAAAPASAPKSEPATPTFAPLEPPEPAFIATALSLSNASINDNAILPSPGATPVVLKVIAPRLSPLAAKAVLPANSPTTPHAAECLGLIPNSSHVVKPIGRDGASASAILARRLALVKYSHTLQIDLTANSKQGVDDAVNMRRAFAKANEAFSDVARRATKATSDAAMAEARRTFSTQLQSQPHAVSSGARPGGGALAAIRAAKTHSRPASAASAMSISGRATPSAAPRPGNAAPRPGSAAQARK